MIKGFEEKLTTPRRGVAGPGETEDEEARGTKRGRSSKLAWDASEPVTHSHDPPSKLHRAAPSAALDAVAENARTREAGAGSHVLLL